MATDPTRARSGDVCPLCGAEVSVAAERCGDCGYHLAGIGGRPGVYSRKALWWTVAAFLVIYVITLVAVAATR